MPDTFRIIISGFGLSGCLLTRMLLEKEHPFFSLVLIDEHFQTDPKHLCFMRNEKIPEQYIKRSWSRISMTDAKGNAVIRDLKQEKYRLLDWQKIFDETLSLCKEDPRVTLVKGRVQKFHETSNEVQVRIEDGDDIIGDKLFNSIRLGTSKSDLLQQFKGAIVEFDEAVYDPEKANLMDFHSHKSTKDVEFKYELPFSRTKALIEYTIITSNPISKAELDKRFSKLLENMSSVRSIFKEESGAIPMPSKVFKPQHSTRIMHIGIAGGFQRRSSGYLLQTIHDQLDNWAEFAFSSSLPKLKKDELKEYLDTVFLSVIKSKPSLSQSLFLAMFRGTSGDQFLRFMFNPMKLRSILPIVLSLPKRPFLKHAAIHFKSLF